MCLETKKRSKTPMSTPPPKPNKHHTPTVGRIGGAEEARKEHVLGPHDAVDGLVRRVAQRAHGVRLGRRLGRALVALALALDVHRHLLFLFLFCLCSGCVWFWVCCVRRRARTAADD